MLGTLVQTWSKSSRKQTNTLETFAGRGGRIHTQHITQFPIAQTLVEESKAQEHTTKDNGSDLSASHCSEPWWIFYPLIILYFCLLPSSKDAPSPQFSLLSDLSSPLFSSKPFISLPAPSCHMGQTTFCLHQLGAGPTWHLNCKAPPGSNSFLSEKATIFPLSGPHRPILSSLYRIAAGTLNSHSHLGPI